MSILIRGMKMPGSCEKCKLDLRTDVCSAFDEWHKEHPYSIRVKDRLPDCPLVELPEKHGRLIDESAVLEMIRKSMCIKDLSFLYNAEKSVVNQIYHAPTVIEAEGDEE